jgi:hypothetical protein
VGLGRADDAAVLEWAANAGYLVATHDVSTMIAVAYTRLADGRPMAGLVVIPQRMPIGEAVGAFESRLGAGDLNAFAGRVTFLKRR